MKARQIIIALIGVAILVGGAMMNKKLSQKEEQPKRPEMPEPVKLVETILVKNGSVNAEIPIYGRISAAEKLDIFSEVSGALVKTSKPFRVGTRFEEGDVLLVVDDREQRLNLQSQKSTMMNAITQLMPDLKLDYPASFAQWQTYLDQFDIDRNIRPLPKPVNEKEKYFIASRNIYSQFYTIQSAEVRLTKFSIFAPFSGVLTQSSVNPGTVIRAGQKLGELMNQGSYELEASISLSALDEVRIGQRVKLHSEDITGEWKGTVRRIGETIDPSTQSAILYIAVSGRKLKENMYLRGEIKAKPTSNVVEIPRKLIVNDEQAYAIEDSKLKLIDLNIKRMTETTALISDLEDGLQLLKENFPGSYEGMEVKVQGEKEEASEVVEEKKEESQEKKFKDEK